MGLLDIIIIVLLVGWLFGVISFREALGSFLHIVLVLAVVLLLVRLLT